MVRPIFYAADGILFETIGTTGGLLHLKAFNPLTLYIASCHKSIKIHKNSENYVSETGSLPSLCRI